MILNIGSPLRKLGAVNMGDMPRIEGEKLMIIARNIQREEIIYGFLVRTPRSPSARKIMPIIPATNGKVENIGLDPMVCSGWGA
jgi:hypothetical protein